MNPLRTIVIKKTDISGSTSRFRELLAADLLPVVPCKGSVGASGDLAQLAHLAQPLIGEGRLRAPGGLGASGRRRCRLPRPDDHPPSDTQHSRERRDCGPI